MQLEAKQLQYTQMEQRCPTHFYKLPLIIQSWIFSIVCQQQHDLIGNNDYVLLKLLRNCIEKDNLEFLEESNQ